jgi:hypothetical protein
MSYGWRAQTLPLRFRSPGADTLDDAAALELCDRPENVHLQLARRRGGVDAFAERDERDAEHLEVVEERDQMLQVAA